MKLSYFKPSDFELKSFLGKSIQEQFCDQANAKLEREAVKLYIYKDKETKQYVGSETKISTDTHTAYLINIQPIKECEHKPMPNTIADLNNIKCSRCGIDLEPTGWRIKE